MCSVVYFISTFFFFFFKQKTAYEMRISDWSSDVCSSDLRPGDLIFFKLKSRRVNHVAIYLGNDRFIHAPRRGKSVTIDTLNKPYWNSHYVLAKRVLPKEPKGMQQIGRASCRERVCPYV